MHLHKRDSNTGAGEHPISRHASRYVLFLLSITIWDPVAARVSQTIDPDTGLQGWHWEGDGISVELIQRLPDQTRAFFMARGFGQRTAERIARDCVFQTIVTNTDREGAAVSIDLRQWSVVTDKASAPLKLKGQWDKEWQRLGVPKAARIAFRWSLFPDRQTFAPGDYNWGMTTMGIPAGTRFDLKLVWQHGPDTHQALISEIACAPDVHPEPEGP
jgi:hypothetical protein